MTSKSKKKRGAASSPVVRNSEILDVGKAAQMLTVSKDTVYDLFKSGELPGRKVGRKWITTRAALLRWVEGSLALNATAHSADSVERALQSGDKTALAKALKASTVRGRRGA